MVVWVDQESIISRITEMGFETTYWASDTYAELDKVILKAQREFERRTRRSFEQADLTERVDGHGKTTIVLSQFPVNSITSIALIDLALAYQPTITGYRFEEATGIVHIEAIYPHAYAVFPEGIQNLEVIYNYGYVTPGSIPDDIKDAIELMTLLQVILRSPKEYEQDGIVSEKIGNFSQSFGAGAYYGGVLGDQKKDWRSTINAIISNYRKVSMR